VKLEESGLPTASVQWCVAIFVHSLGMLTGREHTRALCYSKCVALARPKWEELSWLLRRVMLEVERLEETRCCTSRLSQEVWSQLTEAGCKAERKAEARLCGLMARSLRGLNLLLQDYTADVFFNASRLSLSSLAAICATRVESLQVRGMNQTVSQDAHMFGAACTSAYGAICGVSRPQSHRCGLCQGRATPSSS
jgi:hypothetical protein